MRELVGLAAVIACLLSAGYLLSTFLFGKRNSRFPAVAILSVCLFSLIPLSVPRFRGDGESARFAEFLNEGVFSNTAIYAYRCYPQVLMPYLGRTIGITGYSGELDFGINQLNPSEKLKRFPHLHEFRRQWQSSRRVLVVTTLASLRSWKSNGLSPGWIFLKGRRFVILGNRPMNNAYVWSHSFPNHHSPVKSGS